MVNVGKWLAVIVLAFLAVFLILVFFASQFLQQFMTYSLSIVGVITAGTVVYIIINFNRRKR